MADHGRDAERKRKLAQKPTKSPFTQADEQAARAKAREERGSSKPEEKPAEPAVNYRDYRGVDGVVDDATAAAEGTLQERDTPKL